MFIRWKKSKQKGLKPAQYEVVASLLTDTGCCREVNEDCGRYIKPCDSQRLASKGILALVADGMGGHSAGEVASQLAVAVISRVYYESKEEVPAALKKAFHEANRTIYETSLRDENLKGMGTTCTALVLRDSLAICAHVGDSRLYLVRGGEIYLMSEDHSLVMDMVKRGLITRQEARHHTDKNILLRALGVHPQVEISMWKEPFPAREGDQFLLCSDGLYDLIEDEEIKQAITSANTHSACESLVSLAKERGGGDNITVGLLSLKPLGDSQTKSARETREIAGTL